MTRQRPTKCSQSAVTDAASTPDARPTRRLRRNQAPADATTNTSAADSSPPSLHLEDIVAPCIVRDCLFQFIAATPQSRVFRDGWSATEYKRALAPLALASHQWQSIVKTHVSDADRQKVTIILPGSGSRQAQALHKRLGDAAVATSLVLKAPGRGARRVHSTLCGVVFSSCVNVLRLDLAGVGLDLIVPTLNATSKHLVHLRELVFGGDAGRDALDEDDLVDDGDQEDALASDGDEDGNALESRERAPVDALVLALEKWHQYSGGLRLISLPCWVAKHPPLYERFITALTWFCPRLEYLLDAKLVPGPSAVK